MEYKNLAVSNDVHDELYRMTNNIMGMLCRRGIMCWIDGGTLLGAIRHKAIIPHDDDVDLGVMLFDVDELKKILEKIRTRYKYEVLADYNLNLVKILSRVGDRDICVDIFIWVHMLDGKVELANMNYMKRWPNCYHDEDDFHILTMYDFGPIRVLGPKNPIPYLDRMYPNWRTEIVVTDHKEKILSTYNISDVEEQKNLLCEFERKD